MKLRCPQCSTIVEAVTDPIRCPNCGFSAPLPPGKAPTPTAAPPPPPSYAPPTSQQQPFSYGSPPPQQQPPAYGYSQPVPGYGGQPYGAPAPPSVYGGSRPIGKQRNGFLILLFSFFTLGIYTLVWEWKISKEMDAFTGIPNRHRIIRTAILLMIAGLAVGAIGVIIIFATVPASETATLDSAELGGMLGAVFAILIAIGIVLTATILLLMGFYRIWTALEQDDKMRAQASPTNATLLLVLFILGLIIPYVGFLMVMAVYVMTQNALNRTWAVYGTAMPPAAPFPRA